MTEPNQTGLPELDLVAENGSDEQMPRVKLTRGRIIGSIIFVVAIVAFLYFGLPKLVGLEGSIRKMEHGDAWWLVAAALLEVCSFTGYLVLFRAIFADGSPRIDWGISYQINLAGLAATRLFAAAGAGGIALTAWALRRAGLAARETATRMITFMVLLYGCYMAALTLGGFGLYFDLLPGPRPIGVTLIPGIFGAGVIILVLSMTLVPASFDRMVARLRARPGRVSTYAAHLASVPRAAADGVRAAVGLARRREVGLLGAPAWWLFDIATLWACFHAFGASPPVMVVIMAYFVGWIGNTLPLPGGIGGVEGGLIGAFSAFNVSVQSAVVAVLAYRMFSFWLPTIPGAAAYFQLRRTVARWRSEDNTEAASMERAR